MTLGVDKPISLIRNDLANNLWTTLPKRILYSKCYRNEKNIRGAIQLIPEVYTEKREYREVLFDDNYDLLVFFDAGDERTNIKEDPSADISIYFAVNLESIYPDSAYREEEASHRDVMQVLENSRSSYGYENLSITSGLNAYGDFYRENVKKYNMQPWHTFRVDMEDVNYNYDNCNRYVAPVVETGGFVYPLPMILIS